MRTLKDFDNERLAFEAKMKKHKKQAKIAIVVNLIINGGLIGFGIWVVIKIMQHFGII